MPNMMPSDIASEVREVLLGARRGKGNGPNYLTAFQILGRLPLGTRTRLIEERTIGGDGSGNAFAAPSVVSKAARSISGIQIEYIDCVGLSVQVADQQISPSFEVCAIYRLVLPDDEIT